MKVIKVEFAKVMVATYFVECDDCGYVFMHVDTEEFAHCLSCDTKCRKEDLKFSMGVDK